MIFNCPLVRTWGDLDFLLRKGCKLFFNKNRKYGYATHGYDSAPVLPRAVAGVLRRRLVIVERKGRPHKGEPTIYRSKFNCHFHPSRFFTGDELRTALRYMVVALQAKGAFRKVEAECCSEAEEWIPLYRKAADYLGIPVNEVEE